ncbi:winged helix DNA-binding domain-containing protein [Flindersiella endophytica]
MCADRLDDRAAGRALLARQHLLARAELPVLDAVRRLYGMQAQVPLAPYTGLWARLAGFAPDALGALLLSRSVVRIAALRGTVHLLAADDCLTMRPLMQPLFDRAIQGNASLRQGLERVDLGKLTVVARELLDERPRGNAELRDLLGERWPDHDPSVLASAVRNLLPCVQVPPRGLWGRSGQPVVTTAEAWIGRSAAAFPSPADLVLRYLAAYGPASVMDAQAWCGLTKLGEVFEGLRPSLRTFAAADGTELFDLPDAPRPPADQPAPVRFLPEYDNCLRSHANRLRVVPEQSAALLKTKNDGPKPTFLVDGLVRGTWSFTKPTTRTPATLQVQAFTKLPKRTAAQVTAEAGRLLAFLSPPATGTGDVQLTQPD